MTREGFKVKSVNAIYHFEFGKNFTHALERHDFWEMVYVDSGNVVAIADGNSCKLTQSQLIFHEPGEVHAHVSDTKNPNSMLVVLFEADFSAMDFFRKKIFSADKTTKTLLSLFADEARSAFGKISDEYGKKAELDFSHAEPFSKELLLCYFTELLINIIRKNSKHDNRLVANEKTRTTAQTSLATLVVNYMEENIYSDLTLPDICGHFMLGKSQLGHIFKQSTGKSLMEYYGDVKMQEAKRLLREGALSVSQISDALGFSCIHSFSRAFKKQSGVSPTVYKKKIL